MTGAGVHTATTAVVQADVATDNARLNAARTPTAVEVVALVDTTQDTAIFLSIAVDVLAFVVNSLCNPSSRATAVLVFITVATAT